jgi:hypothetical protein
VRGAAVARLLLSKALERRLSMKRLKHIVEIDMLLGVWLIVVPFILGYSAYTIELANDMAIGALLIGCSWWILATGTGGVGASVLQVLGGLWLIASPLCFHYARLSRVYSNDVTVGILAATVSFMATWMLESRLPRTA